MPYAQDRMIEQCLSHSDGKRTEQVCNRGQYPSLVPDRP